MNQEQLNYGTDYKFVPVTSVGSGVGIEMSIVFGQRYKFRCPNQCFNFLVPEPSFI
ncbi:hypothetical protein [Paenibacillus sp. FSL R7-0026]|uniref:hypothetical protein n=1 Tax=Paenibacillus sp. FSL R7-0026 TaxID=2921668 RepID=UPI0030F5F519